MHRAAVLTLMGCFALSAAASSQPLSLRAAENRSGGSQKAGAECTGGIRYDDGHFESGLFFFGSNTVGRVVSLFQLPAATNRVNAVCVCLFRFDAAAPDTFSANVEIWSSGSIGGVLQPAALLGSFPATFSGVPEFGQNCAFYRVEIPPGFVVNGPRAFIGLQWSPASGAAALMLAGDSSGGSQIPPAYSQFNDNEWRPVDLDIEHTVLGVRAEVSDVAPPPDGPWLTTQALPGFRFKVRIASLAGVQENDCVPETLCVSGAVRGRSEVFVRIIGPRPNGFLWPNIVKFTVSQVEVWIEQLSTSRLRYYKLPAQGPADTTLPGLVDRQAFEP